METGGVKGQGGPLGFCATGIEDACELQYEPRTKKVQLAPSPGGQPDVVAVGEHFCTKGGGRHSSLLVNKCRAAPTGQVAVCRSVCRDARETELGAVTSRQEKAWNCGWGQAAKLTKVVPAVHRLVVAICSTGRVQSKAGSEFLSVERLACQWHSLHYSDSAAAGNANSHR